MIELVGVEPVNERTLYLAEIRSVDDWPETIAEPRPHFAVLVAADAGGVEDERLARFARRLLAQGAVYVCAWGPDCERVHDAFDAEQDATARVTTTWHADDTLDEALWFALFASFPDDAFVETCDAVLAIVVGDADRDGHVRGRVGNPEALWRSGLDGA